MRRMTELAVVTVAAASLTISPSSPNSAETQMAFDEMTAAWTADGVDLSDAQLVTVKPGESYACDEVSSSWLGIESDNPSIALHCPLIGVVVAETSYAALNESAAVKGLSRTAIARQTIGHEIGHIIQSEAEGEPLFGKANELRADCYAGVISQKLYPNSEVNKRVKDIYSLFNNSKEAAESHGTAQERADAFMQGQKSGRC